MIDREKTYSLVRHRKPVTEFPILDLREAKHSMKKRRDLVHRGDSERDVLFSEFQPLVRKLIRIYGTEPGLREELPGEIYCRFCLLLDAYNPERGIPLKPYLVRQLTSSVYTFARHQWRRQKREVLLEPDHGDSIRPHFDPYFDPSETWNDTLMFQGLRQGLPQAFSHLSSRQRQVVIWRYYEAQSFEEIAERLDIQVSTARSILRHGLHNIRRRMEEAGHTYC